MAVGRKLAVVGAMLGALVSMLAMASILGQPARLVDLLGLFGAAFGSGAALVMAVRNKP